MNKMNIFYVAPIVFLLLGLAGLIARPHDYMQYTVDGHIPDTELREFFNVSPSGDLSSFAIDRNSTENFYYEHYKDCQQCKEKVLKMNNYWHDRYDDTLSGHGNMYTSPIRGSLHRHRSGL